MRLVSSSPKTRFQVINQHKYKCFINKPCWKPNSNLAARCTRDWRIFGKKGLRELARLGEGRRHWARTENFWEEGPREVERFSIRRWEDWAFNKPSAWKERIEAGWLKNEALPSYFTYFEVFGYVDETRGQVLCLLISNYSWIWKYSLKRHTRLQGAT